MASSSNKPTRIHLLGSGRLEEGTAGGTFYPGYLLRLNSSNKWIAHNDSLGHAEALFAVEDALQGKTIADAYALGQRATAVLANRGDEVYAWLAGGEAANIGDFLVSDGQGCLKPATESDVAEVRLAVALEAVDSSDSGGAAKRIIVRVL